MTKITGFDYMSESDIYLDSACQTLRPEPVIEAVDQYYREFNACGGRVKFEWGRKVDEAVEKARAQMLKLAGKTAKDYTTAFTLNTTYGINLVLSQLPVADFDQIITSEIEHNSVFVPSISYSRKYNWRQLVLPRAADGSLQYKPDQLAKAVVIVNSSSNFDGRDLINAKQFADDIHNHDGLLIIDGAQTMGHQPSLIHDVDFDALCFSGHKLYGPSLGILIIKKTLLEKLELTFLGGGTVADVQEDHFELVDGEARLEPGLQNYSGIIGVAAAVDWRQQFQADNLSASEYETKLASRLFEAIKTIDGLKVINQTASPIVSFYSPKIDAHKLATYLSAQNIMVRSGYFCSHYYLEAVKHYPHLVRLSLGLNNTAEQIDKTLLAIRQQVGAR